MLEAGFFFLNRAVYEIMVKNRVERGRPQMTILHMRIACCVPKATNTDTVYVTLFVLPLKHRLHERALTLRCKYLACLAITLRYPRIS